MSKIKQSIEIATNRYKAKPIFAEEKKFIETQLPQIAPLPDACWIYGGNTKTVWVDLYSSQYLLKFKVENGGEFSVLKDNRSLFKNYTPVSLEDTLEREKERVNNLYNKCVDRLSDYVKNNPQKTYKINHSGGKDSELTMAIWNDMLDIIGFTPDYEFVFLNSSNETADVYKRIKQIPNIRIINPKMGWRQWIIQNKNYILPLVFRRSCCSVYKEGQVQKIFDKEAEIAQVLGVRKFESTKRAKYEFFMDYNFDKSLFGSSCFPKKWIKLAPIIDLQNVDVWLLLMIKNLPINQRYLNGSSRVGCVICPYSSSYEDELIKIHQPHQYEWFVKAAQQQYDITTAKRLGYTKQEWIDGAWKRPVCKNNDFLKRQPTKENVRWYAELKGLSENMAKKYFNRVCGNCGCAMKENEIAMFYKLCGRFENKPDNREVLCAKCFCKQFGITIEEYRQKNIEFIEQGCNLF